MSLTWQDLAFQLEPAVAREVAKAWSWLVPEPWEPIICSVVGGVFLQTANGSVLWLDTGAGLVEQVAQSRAQFEEACRSSELVTDWFLHPIVERLHAAGKKPGEGECYGFIISPVFAEGGYDTDNMFVLSVKEQMIVLADFHRQLNGLPDGTSVQIEIKD